jgi:hypothetical protein
LALPVERRMMTLDAGVGRGATGLGALSRRGFIADGARCLGLAAVGRTAVRISSVLTVILRPRDADGAEETRRPIADAPDGQMREPSMTDVTGEHLVILDPRLAN